MTRKHYKRIGEKEFDTIKSMLNAGVSPGQVRKITGRSWNVCSFIKESSNFSEYQTVSRKYYAGHPATPSENTSTTGEVPTTHVEFRNANTELVEVLHSIRNELSRLADAWERTPTKSGWFK